MRAHLSFSPCLWGADIVETPVTKSRPADWAVRVHYHLKNKQFKKTKTKSKSTKLKKHSYTYVLTFCVLDVFIILHMFLLVLYRFLLLNDLV